MLAFLSSLFFLSNAWAIHEDFENHEWSRPLIVAAGAVATTYIISEAEQGPAIFAGIYSAGSLYLMNEWFQTEKDITELMVPFGLLTLGIVNITLLRDDETYSENDVFVYNLAGLSILTAYAMWEHKIKSTPNSSLSFITPMFRPDGSGLLISLNY